MSMRIVAVALAALCATAQNSDQQTYERYRAWITSQPVAVQRDPNHLNQYREHLTNSGVAGEDIEKQVRTIESRGRQLEVNRWNTILTAEKPAFNINPNAFLVAMVKDRKPGTALDVGMGQGRNALWLAQKGWTVTGFDPAEKAVALAVKNAEKAEVKIATAVSTSEEFDYGENKWDLIVLSYVAARESAEAIQRALALGGIVVLEGFHRDATRGRSIGSGVVYDAGELPALFRHLRVVHYEEPLATPDFGRERLRVVRLCAEKPAER